MSAFVNTHNISRCRYCQQEVRWREKRPYNGDNTPHHCSKYPGKKNVVFHLPPNTTNEIDALREEVDLLRKLVATNTGQEKVAQPANDFKKRIERLESIVVDLRRDIESVKNKNVVPA